MRQLVEAQTFGYTDIGQCISVYEFIFITRPFGFAIPVHSQIFTLYRNDNGL